MSQGNSRPSEIIIVPKKDAHRLRSEHLSPDSRDLRCSGDRELPCRGFAARENGLSGMSNSDPHADAIPSAVADNWPSQSNESGSSCYVNRERDRRSLLWGGEYDFGEPGMDGSAPFIGGIWGESDDIRIRERDDGRGYSIGLGLSGRFDSSGAGLGEQPAFEFSSGCASDEEFGFGGGAESNRGCNLAQAAYWPICLPDGPCEPPDEPGYDSLSCPESPSYGGDRMRDGRVRTLSGVRGPPDFPGDDDSLAARPAVGRPLDHGQGNPEDAPGRPAGNELNGKFFLLTYPHCDFAKIDLAEFLRSKGEIERLIIGQERHADGDWHLHAFVEYKNRKSHVRQRYFDWRGKHPNIQIQRQGANAEKSIENCWNYCKKEDPDPYIFGEEPAPKKKQRRELVFRKAHELAKSSSTKDAMDCILSANAYEGLVHYDQLERAFQHERQKCQLNQTPARPLVEFVYAPAVPDNWRCLFIYGETALGKTAWARALLPEAIVIRHTDQLRVADTSKGLIFDDYSIRHWPAPAAIHLTDFEENSGINIKHGHVVIPAGTRKIFTFNLPFDDWLPEACDEMQKAAVRRRVHVIHINTRLF